MLNDVQAALIKAYESSGLRLPTEYENSPFNQTAGEYASIFFVPTQPSAITLSDSGEDLVNGFLQIDIYTKRNSGTFGARKHYETLSTKFKAGTRFTANAQEVIISSCGRSQSRTTDTHLLTTVTVIWRAYITR